MHKKIMKLPVIRELSPGVTLRTLGELNIIVIDNAFCQAALSLQGAHLLLWQPSTQKFPVLWLSKCSSFKKGDPIRGGIPICWPWFTDKGGQPHHGFARILPWAIEDIYSRPRSVQLTLSLTDNPESLAIWNHHFHLTMTFVFTENVCELMLKMQGDFTVTSALHSYFQSKDIRRLTIDGLNSTGIDTLDGMNKSWPDVPFAFDGEAAIIFTTPEDKSIIRDRSISRNITVTHANHSDVVAWNPGPDRIDAIADIANEDWDKFVCVETASVSRPLVCSWQKPVTLGAQLCVGASSRR